MILPPGRDKWYSSNPGKIKFNPQSRRKGFTTFTLQLSSAASRLPGFNGAFGLTNIYEL